MRKGEASILDYVSHTQVTRYAVGGRTKHPGIQGFREEDFGSTIVGPVGSARNPIVLDPDKIPFATLSRGPYGLTNEGGQYVRFRESRPSSGAPRSATGNNDGTRAGGISSDSTVGAQAHNAAS